MWDAGMCLWLEVWERASQHPAKRDDSFLLSFLVPLCFNSFLHLLRWTKHPLLGHKLTVQFRSL